jgi:hypothetical protein
MAGAAMCFYELTSIDGGRLGKSERGRNQEKENHTDSNSLYLITAGDGKIAAMRRLVLLLFTAAVAFASDLTGIWVGQLPGRNGGVDDLAFRFKLDGQALTGKLLGDEFDLTIADASVTGDQVKFTVTTTNYYSGGKTKFQYTGTVKGGEMELVRERVPAPDDRPNANRQPLKQTIKLKRLN